jgi:hypothetical protein
MTRDEAMQVYKVQHERFRQTKELQWKINLASWALIALGINSADKIRRQLDVSEVIITISIFFLAQMIFSYRTQRALEADKIISRDILRQLSLNVNPNENIHIDIKKLTKKIYPGGTGWWWLFFQGFVTGILLLLLYFMTT